MILGRYTHTPEPPKLDAGVSFDDYLKRRMRENWTILSDGPSGIQIVAPRRFGPVMAALTVIGALLVFAGGVGLLVLVGVLLWYCFQSRAKEFLKRPE